MRIWADADNSGTENAGDRSFDSMVPLAPFMLAGTYNPGQLQIVREIKYATGPDFDTAVFSGNLADYSFFDFGDFVQVSDLVGLEGTDTLKHIERLQFADQTVVLDGTDNEPVGAFNISDTTPMARETLTVSIAGVTDAEHNPGGNITGPVAYFWQVETVAGLGHLR